MYVSKKRFEKNEIGNVAIESVYGYFCIYQEIDIFRIVFLNTI